MKMASETTQTSALRTDEAASHGPLWRLIDCAVTAHANRAKVPVNRKAYLRWCLLGVFGAQRFYAKQWKMGLLYLVTCWSGFSIAMTMIDAMIAVPMKPDENGIIYLRGLLWIQGNSACWQNFRVAPAQYAEKQLLLLVIISGKIAFHFRADMLN